MVKTPVSKLMAKNSDNLLGLTLLNQSIVDNNMLLPRQAIEVRITMRAPLTSVNNMQVRKREIQSLSQALHTSLQCARLKRRQLIEQRKDSNRINRNSEYLKEDTKEPKIIEEAVPSLLHNLQEGTNNRCTEDNTQHLTFQHIRYPQLNSLLIKSELLLEDESAVVRDRKRHDRSDKIEPKDEDQRLRDLTREPFGEIVSENETRERPEFRESIVVDKPEVLNLTVETGDESKLGFCSSVCLL